MSSDRAFLDEPLDDDKAASSELSIHRELLDLDAILFDDEEGTDEQHHLTVLGSDQCLAQ